MYIIHFKKTFGSFQSAKILKFLDLCKKITPFSTFFKIIFCQIQKKVVILRRISQKQVGDAPFRVMAN